MIIVGVAIGMMLIMKLFPETPAARLLHGAFVERPAAWTRQHLIYAAMFVGLIFAGGEFVMLAGGADFAMLMAWDMALLFDVTIAAWTAASITRVRAMRTYVMTRLRGLGGRSARPRTARSRVRALKRDSNANDDEPGWLALAA